MNVRIHHVMRAHGVALMFALAMGLVYASHHFFIPLLFLDSEKEIYEPLAGDYGDEVLLYGPRAHDAFLHFGIRGDFSLAEFPKSPAILPMLNPLLLGGLGKIFGSMNAGIIASDILFPSLIFFVLYLFICEAGASRSASVFFSTLFVMSPQFGISIPPVSSSHLRTLAQAVFPFLAKNEALYFSHFDDPKLTFLFFAFFLYMLTRALKRQNRSDIMFAGISFGILFYTYLYDWATIITSLCLMAIYFFATKDYRRFKIIVAIIAIGICISSYYWINLFMLRNLSTGHDIIARLGGEFSHHLRFATVWKSYVRAIILIVLLWTYASRQAKEAVIVLGSVLLSYVIVVNEQVITGFNIQPDHWYRVQFLAVSAGVFLLGYALYGKWASARVKLYESAACYVFVVYALLVFFIGQYAYSAEKAHAFAFPNAYRESLAWLEANTQNGSVVGTLSMKGNLDLQMYTKNKIFLPFGLSTIASDKELWNRYMILARLWNVDPDAFTATLRGGMLDYLFGTEYKAHTFDADFLHTQGGLPDNVIARKREEYVALLKNKHLIFPYRLDYLFVDREEFFGWQEPRHLLASLIKVFDNGRISIFRVR